MQHEGWVIVMGDCLDVLRALPPESADVVPTSPPYNQAINYHQHNDRMPRCTYLDWIKEVFVATYRVLKYDGSFFLNINGSGTAEDPTLPYAIIDRALAAGFVLQNEIVWIKVDKVNDVLSGHFKPVTSKKYLDRAHERFLHLTKSGGVVIDKLAIGVPFADKCNINRRNTCATGAVAPTSGSFPTNGAVESGEVRSSRWISRRAARPLHQAAWVAS